MEQGSILKHCWTRCDWPNLPDWKQWMKR